ncbi:MAG: TetR/AcrR family transcriptional regulator, partial [Natronospirillum sp.]
MTEPPRSNYHHGNLKEALLNAAFETLEHTDLGKLSLRGLARQVGVTPTAAYSHFSDKIALLVELKTVAFARFEGYLSQAVHLVPTDDPENRIRALGRAYLTFAREHPSLFNLLFSWTPELNRITPECMEAGARGEELLRHEVSQLLRASGCEMTEYQAAVASFSAWSMVHGVTSLLQAGTVDAATFCHNWPAEFSTDNPEAQAKVLEHVLSIQLAGLKHAM